VQLGGGEPGIDVQPVGHAGRRFATVLRPVPSVARRRRAAMVRSFRLTVAVAGKGTSIFIYLPRTQMKLPEEGPALPGRSDDHTGSAHILLVDDDNGVREITAELLRDMGYEVLEAGSGGAAMETLQREPNIDLMLIDFALPGMTGADVARSVHASKPALPTLFITGYADHRALRGVSESHIISKPFRPDELAHKVRAALAEVGAAVWN